MKNKYYIKSNIIYAENKRAQKKGLINNLTDDEFNNWCIEWWINKNDDGILRCPYSGKVIDNNINKQSSIVLEHIIPIEKGGGTILFNVLPSRTDVNCSKHDTDPIDWWINNFNKERFFSFVEYIFDAYDKLIEKGSITNEIIINIQDLEPEEEKNNYNTDIPEEFLYDLYIKENNNKKENTKKIKYHSFLATCVSIVENYDKTLGKKYRNKILEYEKKGIFKNITNFQNIQSVLFNKIKQVDSSIKYIIVRNINMSLFINSMKDIDNPENEIEIRLNAIKQLIENEICKFTLSDVLINCPNILILKTSELLEKIKLIKSFEKKINPILLLKNNKKLVLLNNKELIKTLEYIKKNFNKKNYEYFINSGNIKYLKVIEYLESCEKSTLLKNIQNNKNEENLGNIWKKNIKTYFNGNFINTLKILIKNKNYKFTLSEKTIKIKDMNIIDLLYEKVEKNINLVYDNNQLKVIIKEIINNTDVKYIKSLIGDTLEEKKKNLIKLLYECVNENLIQDYFYLEIIRKRKIDEIEKKELIESVEKVKEYILKSDVNGLTIKELNEVTKNLPGIWKLNTGGFHSRLKQRIIYTRGENNKQEYIGKKDVGIIIDSILKDYDFTKKINENELKNKIEIIIVESLRKYGKNIFPVYNYLSETEKIKKIKTLFFKEVENYTLPAFLMLEQLIRNKKNEVESKEKLKKTLLQEKEELEKTKELNKLVHYIKSRKEIKDLRFESINKIKRGNTISLNEWINININTAILNLNNLNVESGSFAKSLIEKIRSSSTKFTIKKNISRSLIVITINEINSKLNFLNKPSNDEIKKIIDNILVNIKNNANYIIELEGYKGNNLEEKITNFKKLMYRAIEKNNIQLYLMLEQLVQKQKEEILLEKQKNDHIDMKRSA